MAKMKNTKTFPDDFKFYDNVFALVNFKIYQKKLDILTTALEKIGSLIEIAGYSVPYNRLTEEVKIDFKKWVSDNKQQNWENEDGWHKAWFNYEREFLRHIATAALQSYSKKP